MKNARRFLLISVLAASAACSSSPITGTDDSGTVSPTTTYTANTDSTATRDDSGGGMGSGT